MNLKEIIIDIINMERNTISINCINNTVNINGKNKVITEDKIYDLLRIIRNWEPEYYNENSLDKESYKIELIDKNDEKELLTGQGKYPAEYKLLKDWIRGL